MARAAMHWVQDAQPIYVELADEGETLLGRGRVAALTDRTVSREHARVTADADGYMIENASGTNQTIVNGVTLERPVRLSDGDRVQLGQVTLVFDDLAASDRISGPMCSHCSRENLAADAHCWFCGTALVNAPTVAVRREATLCRLVAADGSIFDLHAGEALAFSDGVPPSVLRAEQLADAAAAVTVEGDQPTLRAGDAAISIDDEALETSRALRSGDRLRAGNSEFVAVVR